MIALKLKSGEVWTWEADDEFEVLLGDDAEPTTIRVGDVAELIVEGIDKVSGLDIEVAGQPARGVVQVDETGIRVVTLWPLEVARLIGKNLGQGVVVEATPADMRRLQAGT